MRDYTQYQKTFSVDVVNDYYTLLGQKNTIRNNYANYLARKEATIRARARQGWIPSETTILRCNLNFARRTPTSM